MIDQITCNNCKKEYKLSYCLVKTLGNRKCKFILPCGHTKILSNINFNELLKLFNKEY